MNRDKKVRPQAMPSKRDRNAENIKQVTDVLTRESNYRCGSRSVTAVNGTIEFWVGPGTVPVIAIQYHANDNGFEVWVPLTQSNLMDETLYALRTATSSHLRKKSEPCHYCHEPIAGGPRCTHCGAL